MTEAGPLAAQADLLVNATAVSAPSESPEMADMIGRLKPGPNCGLVMDINYGRDDNFWRLLAEKTWDRLPGRPDHAGRPGLPQLQTLDRH